MSTKHNRPEVILEALVAKARAASTELQAAIDTGMEGPDIGNRAAQTIDSWEQVLDFLDASNAGR